MYFLSSWRRAPVQLVALIVGAFFFATTAAAIPVEEARLSEEDRADIARVEAYLNGITTLQSRFRQFDSAGRTASGDVYVERPGKLRFEYDPPVPILIVATGRFLIHYDRDLQSATHLLQSRTPAWFLVAPKVTLSGDVTVTAVDRRDDLLLVSLVRTKQPEEGTVTLAFTDEPLTLRQWTVLDPQGIETLVVLEDPTFGESIRSDKFRFDEPLWTDHHRSQQ